MKSLKGQVALVTGGNSGIGKETARLFAQEGAQVIITGRRKDVLESAVAEIGCGAVGIAGDISDLAHQGSLANEVKHRFGGLDIYVANAGVIHLSSAAEVTIADYDHQFDVNTRGTFFGVQTMLPLMRDAGRIILVSSLAASKVLENHAVYAATKAAINSFARYWALELKARRIRVNVLSPGPVDTSILAKLGISEDERPRFEEMMRALIPAGRFGEAEELAQAALFLASDSSSFINGMNLHADGGMSLV